MKADALIEIRSLRYAYRPGDPATVLTDIDLGIAANEHILISGSSGSGKSTLCRTFNGLIPHFYGGRLEGQVRVAGRDTAGHSVAALFDQVGMVFQNPEAQLFNRTVRREIAFGLESLGLARRDILTRIEDSADRLGITNLLERAPHRLSGGEQQLVATAAVLALGPRLLVLDEPYANLDTLHAERLRMALRQVHARGTGIVVCEHRLAPSAAEAERLVVLQQGRLVRNGPPAMILEKDVTPLGLEVPPAVILSRQLGITPCALRPEDLPPTVPLGAAASLPPMPGPHRSDEEVIVEVEGLCHAVDGRPVLEDVSFSLRRGEIVAVVGANGAGKTTLLRHLNGLLRPHAGCVRVLGHATTGQPVSRLAARVALAFQNPNSQFFKLTVDDEIRVGPRALGRLDPAWLDDLINLFRLEHLRDRAPFRLSSGEKKRVAFAAALAARPAVLALDEPTAGQDGFFRQGLGRLLQTIAGQGRTVVLVTHDLTFAERYAPRWLVLADGRLLADGHPETLMADSHVMQAANLAATDGFRLRRLVSQNNTR